MTLTGNCLKIISDVSAKEKFSLFVTNANRVLKEKNHESQIRDFLVRIVERQELVFFTPDVTLTQAAWWDSL